VADNEQKDYEKLAKYLQGGGTKDIRNTLKKINLLSIISSFSEVAKAENLQKMKVLKKIRTGEYEIFLYEYLQTDIVKFVSEVADYFKSPIKPLAISDLIISELDSLLAEKLTKFGLEFKENTDYFIIIFILLRHLGKLISRENYEVHSAQLIDELMLGDEIEKNISKLLSVSENRNFVPFLKIALKYHPVTKESAIKNLERVSKPGLRKYTDTENLPRVLNGLGIAIISTSKGLMTDKEARNLNVGGEIVCHVW